MLCCAGIIELASLARTSRQTQCGVTSTTELLLFMNSRPSSSNKTLLHGASAIVKATTTLCSCAGLRVADAGLDGCSSQVVPC